MNKGAAQLQMRNKYMDTPEQSPVTRNNKTHQLSLEKLNSSPINVFDQISNYDIKDRNILKKMNYEKSLEAAETIKRLEAH